MEVKSLVGRFSPVFSVGFCPTAVAAYGRKARETFTLKIRKEVLMGKFLLHSLFLPSAMSVCIMNTLPTGQVAGPFNFLTKGVKVISFNLIPLTMSLPN